MPFISFAELKERIKIEQVAEMLGLQTKAAFGKLRSACPKCNAGGDRAIVITPEKGVFNCFAAKQGGDMIQLVSHILNVPVNEAAQKINNHFGGKAEPAQQPPKPKEQENVRSLTPLAYLVAEHEAVQVLGISKETAEQYGIGYAPKGTLRTRVCVPIHSRDGTLLAYCGIGENPKYLFPQNFDPASLIWNAHRVQEGELYLVRDLSQALSALENGMENVACWLTETLQPIQFEMMAALLDQKKCEAIPYF